MHEEFGIELSRSCPILGILFVSKVLEKFIIQSVTFSRTTK